MINSVTAKENLKNKTYDALLEDIYVDKSLVDYHRERYIKARWLNRWLRNDSFRDEKGCKLFW